MRAAFFICEPYNEKNMHIYSTASIKEIDRLTMLYEPISSYNLMERAAARLTDALRLCYARCNHFVLFAGAGNNGGDGLVMARRLLEEGCAVDVWMVTREKLSLDCSTALERLREAFPSCAIRLTAEGEAPAVGPHTVVIDALFGSGLNRPLGGEYARVVRLINSLACPRVAVDIPSGLMGEDNGPASDAATIVRADTTLTLQFPKLSMLLDENKKYVGRMRLLDIGLSLRAMSETAPITHTIEAEEVRALLLPRFATAHKGNFGRALLVAGSRGMAGASVLAARAAMRSGLGLLTVHLPACNNAIVQTAVPEAMTSIDGDDNAFTAAPDTARYTAVGVGPGIGRSAETAEALHALIENCRVPMVIDADALNILADNKEWLDSVPEGSVITPHRGEFARLAGSTADGGDALTRAREFAVRHKICIVLKGACTIIVNGDGSYCLNTRGNAGMATGGSGDALTGIILALLAGGYRAYDAARVAVYVHSVAGDEAAARVGQTSLVAGDIIEYLPVAWCSIENISEK